ncbi:sensor histidine kinase [Streptomyces tsukubensis]|uniref:histidine kinase n=1 Tax=Streptomyces tsukubensis TaxID=83656 RepID=A0A1V4A5Q4_9ACTN|nr:sensor histidine kinase [Streptomyces tsukubensis]OON75945.1 sensor histidine kinase [Streptomyces tsukubensis]QFR94038.1 sensor histidine kinase [Streptomyces tsukubensis]
MTTTGEEHRTAGGPLWWGLRRSAVLDVGLALASAVESAFEGISFAQRAGIAVPVGLVFGVVTGSVLLLRRRWPVAVVLVGIAVTPAQMGFLLGLVGLYTLAASELPRRIIGALAGMSLAGALIVTMVRSRQDAVGHDWSAGVWFAPLMSVLVSVGLTAPPLLLGMYVGARRRLMESLRERADSLERELQLLADRAEERAEWARGEERRRIAREMHDVVAHRVSLMVVHAAALQAVALKDPQKAVRNAALVGDMGRQALTELREMLGVLRSGEGASASGSVPGAVSGSAAPASASGSAPSAGAAGSASGVSEAAVAASAGSGGAGAGSGDGAVSVAAVAVAGSGAGVDGVSADVPLAAVGVAAARAASRVADEDGPCLAELEELVGQSRAAGMVVELLVEGEVRAYASDVESTAYRVVQEALTNVHKHAAGSKAVVRLAHRVDEVAMQVENGAPPEGGADARLPSGGNGLVGMRERVTALGGVFVSGATEAGGFRVSAVLPGRVPGAASGA